MKNKFYISILSLLLFSLIGCNNTTIEKTVNFTENDKYYQITQGGTYTLSGNLNGYIDVDTNEDVTLKLNNINIQSINGPVIFAEGFNMLTIETIKDSNNSFTDISNYNKTEIKGLIDVETDITFKGEGTLNLSSKYGHAINADNITIENGTINILDSVSDGFNVSEKVIINDGIITIDSSEEGIQAENIEINNGNIQINSIGDGIRAESKLTINNGIIDINSETEGLESKNTIIINNGEINIKSLDDGINGINNIEINNGTLNIISANNDAIDSNGTLTINNGNIIANGSMMPEGGIDCDFNSFKIIKGNLIATGGTNSSANTDMYILNIGTILNKEDILQINDITDELNSNIEMIYTYKSNSNISNIMICSEKIEKNKTYAILVNETQIYTFKTTEENIISLGNVNNNQMFDKENRPNKGEFNKEMPNIENMPQGEFPNEKMEIPKDFNYSNAPNRENFNGEFFDELPTT